MIGFSAVDVGAVRNTADDNRQEIDTILDRHDKCISRLPRGNPTAAIPLTTAPALCVATAPSGASDAAADDVAPALNGR